MFLERQIVFHILDTPTRSCATIFRKSHGEHTISRQKGFDLHLCKLDIQYIRVSQYAKKRSKTYLLICMIEAPDIYKWRPASLVHGSGKLILRNWRGFTRAIKKRSYGNMAQKQCIMYVSENGSINSYQSYGWHNRWEWTGSVLPCFWNFPRFPTTSIDLPNEKHQMHAKLLLEQRWVQSQLKKKW